MTAPEDSHPAQLKRVLGWRIATAVVVGIVDELTVDGTVHDLISG